MKKSILLMAVLFALVSLCLVFASCDSGSSDSSDPTPVLPEDALSGVFTVNAEGKTVHFSKGNLQATINVAGVPTAWKFAEKQYDYLGEDGANKSIGTAGGDIDLFGWSTDATSNNWGIHTKKEATQNYTTGNFKDWGKAIGDGNTWHTLSKDEWMYLLNTRTVNGDTVEGYSYQNAIINSDATGVYGMILYPDDYTEQTTATIYTSAEWLAMEKAGCVFLPAAGHRYGSDVGCVGSYGHYWSSTPNDSDRAYSLYFVVGSYVSPASSGMRGYGCSVRLVCGE